jgi:hypothetical protein
MTTQRIRWTNEERNIVIEAAAKKLNSGLRIADALYEGQQVLPPRRWRPKDSLQNAGDIVAAVRKLAKSTIPATRFSNTPAIKPNEPPIEQLSGDSSAHLVHQKDDSIDSLVQAIAEKLANVLRKEVVKVVKELEHEFKVTKHNPEYETQGKSKPRVIIIGLRHDQEAMITHEYSNRYDLKFITTDDAKHVKVSDADAYLLMKNFISHVVYERYQIFKNHVLIDGGMTALRGWLSTKGAEL